MRCRFVASDQPRAVSGRHGDECPGDECRGCLPCPEPHCFVQWYGDRGDCETHATTVCPSCVGKVREHLSEIVRLSALPLVGQAILGGDVNSEAADLLGPAANPKAWRQRGRHGHKYAPDTRVGEQHPEWVLGRFDLIVTEHLGHTRTQAVGVASSAAYLGTNLNYLAADIEFDFADLAEEVAGCRSHLEAVLHEGEQRDEGVPCMTCGRPLTRLWGTGSREDGWECKRCHETSTEAQYRFAVKADYIENADWLTDSDMVVRFSDADIAAATIRSWASDRPGRPATVRKRRHSERIEFCVEDVAARLADRSA